jgi:hypothetical protein
MNLINHVLYLKPWRIAREHELELDAIVFNYSLKWLISYKKACGIIRIDMHGEGADADLDSAAIVKRKPPSLLAETHLEKISNFDETGDHPGVVIVVVIVAGGIVALAYSRSPWCS